MAYTMFKDEKLMNQLLMETVTVKLADGLNTIVLGKITNLLDTTCPTSGRLCNRGCFHTKVLRIYDFCAWDR